MSFKPHLIHITDQKQPAWPGMAVLIEAMVLLTVLVSSLAIIMQLFSAATIRAQQGQRLADAVACATSAAESFASDPVNADGTTTHDDLIVVCRVTDQKTKSGTLYHATITVLEKGTVEPIYELATSRYAEGVSP